MDGRVRGLGCVFGGNVVAQIVIWVGFGHGEWAGVGRGSAGGGLCPAWVLR